MSSSEPLEFFLGETIVLSFALNEANGQDMDLTGATTELRISKRSGGPPMLVNSSPTIATPTSGNGSFTITPAQQATALLRDGVYQYAIVVTKASGVVSVQADGFLTLNRPARAA